MGLRPTQARWPFLVLMIAVNLTMLCMPTAWFSTELFYVAFFGLPVLTLIVAVHVVIDGIREDTRAWIRRINGG